jgi:glutaredoxin
MKLSKLLFAVLSGAVICGANAADITIYYSPTCPHCHHARDFIKNNLIYEYETLKVSEVNVMDADNRQDFFAALKKCGYERGGVPVLVVGEKCFQGYSDASQPDLRAAVEVDLTAEQKNAAAANKTEMEKNKETFVAAHSERKNAISEKDTKKKITNKTNNISDIMLYGFFGLLLIGLGIVLFKKQK